ALGEGVGFICLQPPPHTTPCTNPRPAPGAVGAANALPGKTEGDRVRFIPHGPGYAAGRRAGPRRGAPGCLGPAAAGRALLERLVGGARGPRAPRGRGRWCGRRAGAARTWSFPRGLAASGRRFPLPISTPKVT